MRAVATKLPLTVAAAISAAAAGYSVTLLVAASRRPRERDDGPPGEAPTLAVVVPAHDEATTIERSLRSLRAVDYPPARWRILVVADNCSDDTASLAAPLADQVLVRDEPQRRGKGHAVADGMRALMDSPERPDAVAVVDADCTVSPNFAAAIARELARGAEVVQTSNRVSNPCASRYSALRFAAFSAINLTRPLGRARLGASAGLLGTGMAFSASLLAHSSWESFGLAEDAEQHAALVADGYRVSFAPDAAVESEMPTTFATAESQQARWESGRLALAKRWVPRLARRGLRRRDPTAAVAALDLAVPPLSPLLAATAMIALAASLTRATVARRLALAALVGQVAYVLGSLRAARAPACVYRALAAAPLLAAWEVRVLSRSLGRRAPREWVRTRREMDGGGARYAP